MAASTDNAPLAVYRERLPQVTRLFALYADRIEVDASWTLGKKQRTVVALAELDPNFTRRLVRNRWFKKAVLVASLAVGTAVVLGQPNYAPLLRRFSDIAWLLSGMGAVVAVASFRRRRFVLFSNRTGRTGLDLCDAGPDRSRFDAFVTEVQKRIRQAKRATGNG